MKASSVSQIIKRLELKSDPIYLPNDLVFKGGKSYFGEKQEYEIRIADTVELKKKAYQLIYQIYLEKGFIEPHPSKMWFSDFDEVQTTITLVVLKGTIVVGAVTLHYNSDSSMPASSLYPVEIRQLAKEDFSLVEVVSLGVDPAARGSTEILTKLFNISYIISTYIRKVDAYIVTVNPRHSFFYCRKLLFKEIGGLKKCPKVSGAPANLLKLKIADAKLAVINFRLGLSKCKSLYDGFVSKKDEERLLPGLKSQLIENKKNFVSLSTLLSFREKKYVDLLQVV